MMCSRIQGMLHKLQYNSSHWDRIVFTEIQIWICYRTAEDHDPRLVLINFGETEQVVDVTKLTNVFGEKLRVLVAGTETCYEKGLE